MLPMLTGQQLVRSVRLAGRIFGPSRLAMTGSPSSKGGGAFPLEIAAPLLRLAMTSYGVIND